MNKLPIFVVTAAAVLLSAAACKSQVERETEDVEDARQELQEEKQELQEEKQEELEDVDEARSELHEEQHELQEAAVARIEDAEQRYLALEQTMNKYSLDTTRGIGAELEQARLEARAKLDAARNAAGAEQIRVALSEVDAALDAFEQQIGDFEDEV